MERQARKEAALDFLRHISDGEITQAFTTYTTPDFVHHNPHFKGDAKSLSKGMEESHTAFPNRTYNVLHIVAEGDLVVVHSAIQIGNKREVLVHIMRFDGDKIAELWDVGEEIPENSPNENGI